MKARRSGGSLLYYYQRDGKAIPLGRDYSDAEDRANAHVKLSRTKSLEQIKKFDDLKDLTAEAIIAGATPARRQAGVYFLILNGAISYVGQSADVWARISQHTKNRSFDSFAWIPCPTRDLLRMEAACIKRFLEPILKPPVARH